MQPTNTRRRMTAVAPAAPVVRAPVCGPPVLRFVMANGHLEIEDAVTAARLLEAQQRDWLAAEAEQAQLSKIYTVATLSKRLGISVRSVGDIIRDGRIRYTCCGAKNYRISELACREFLGDAPAAH
jgi:excisionase family DNA binding protein